MYTSESASVPVLGTSCRSTTSLLFSHSNHLKSTALNTFYLQQPTPIIVTEDKLVPSSQLAAPMAKISNTIPSTTLMIERSYHQPPQQMASDVPLSTTIYQPKFFQHPLVSGHIPPTINITNSNGYIGALSLAAHSTSNEEYQKSLLSKKPTASILSNGGATIQNGHHYQSNHHNQSQQQQHIRELPFSGNCRYSNATMAVTAMKDSSGKSGTGEKNKVKFSDTVQVAVVPVGKHSNHVFLILSEV